MTTFLAEVRSVFVPDPAGKHGPLPPVLLSIALLTSGLCAGQSTERLAWPEPQLGADARLSSIGDSIAIDGVPAHIYRFATSRSPEEVVKAFRRGGERQRRGHRRSIGCRWYDRGRAGRYHLDLRDWFCAFSGRNARPAWRGHGSRSIRRRVWWLETAGNLPFAQKVSGGYTRGKCTPVNENSRPRYAGVVIVVLVVFGLLIVASIPSNDMRIVGTICLLLEDGNRRGLKA